MDLLGSPLRDASSMVLRPPRSGRLKGRGSFFPKPLFPHVYRRSENPRKGRGRR
jgi:hypothetical protein